MPLAFVRWLLSAMALLALLLLGFAVGAEPKTPLANYPTAQEAEKHCPDDLVVWLDLPTRSYHYRGQRWYGSTKSLTRNWWFSCASEAAGDKLDAGNHEPGESAFK
jgi:hypothetical protein